MRRTWSILTTNLDYDDPGAEEMVGVLLDRLRRRCTTIRMALVEAARRCNLAQFTTCGCCFVCGK